MATEHELCAHQLVRSRAPFLEPADLRPNHRVEGDVLEWRASPESKRLAKERRSLLRLRVAEGLPPVLDQPHELCDVEIVVRDSKQVAARNRG